MKVPDIRVGAVNKKKVNPSGDFVLYWMMAFRRTRWNFSLDRAIEWAKELRKPLAILEDLRCGNRWDCDRFHQFAIDGMRDNVEDLTGRDVLYYPHVEQKKGDAEQLLVALTGLACVVVTDQFPSFVYPKWVKKAGKEIDVLLEQVDSNGIVPLCTPDQVHKTAYSFRRAFQRDYCPHLESMPKAYPFRNVELPRSRSLPKRITERWPSALSHGKKLIKTDLSRIPIDHGVTPCGKHGGRKAAEKLWREFLVNKLEKYAELRNEPEADVTSGLSPYLHFGHISGHQVVAELMKAEGWLPEKAAKKGKGQRSGWWGMSEGAEGFVDQVITWRELGYNTTYNVSDYDSFESVPEWARNTLKKHKRDTREYAYSSQQFESAGTHDELWNAAQRQLVTEGIIHNYLRMLWGKKILEWSKQPEDALELMIHLNNKYALDGRNPNSYSGIFWCLGRYDRPWGPEREIFGTVRYMSSENTARKVDIRNYIRRYGE